MQIQLPPHIEQAIFDAFINGDYDRVADQLSAAIRENGAAISIKTATFSDELERMPETIDIEQLKASQQASTVDNFRKRRAEFWPEEDNADEFLSFLRRSRSEATPELN